MPIKMDASLTSSSPCKVKIKVSKSRASYNNWLDSSMHEPPEKAVTRGLLDQIDLSNQNQKGLYETKAHQYELMGGKRPVSRPSIDVEER